MYQVTFILCETKFKDFSPCQSQGKSNMESPCFEWELRRAVCKHRRALGSGSRISIQCNHELLMAHMAAIVVATSCHKRQGERVYQIHDPWPAANTVPMLWLARRYRLTVCLSNARPICLESESLVGNRTRATRTCTCNRPENCDRTEDGTGRSRIRVYVVREFNKLEVILTCTLNELCYYSWVEMCDCDFGIIECWIVDSPDQDTGHIHLPLIITYSNVDMGSSCVNKGYYYDGNRRISIIGSQFH